MSRQITLTLNEQTLQAIEDLKGEFDVNSTAAVIRRALALARVATKNADEDHTVTIVGKDKMPQKVLLSG